MAMPDSRQDFHRSIQAERAPGQDADDWVSIYTHLNDVTRQQIVKLRDLMHRQPDEVRDELERDDIRLLQRQEKHYRRRIEFWRSNLTEQADAPGT